MANREPTIDISKYKTILWDFDGVLMDSMPARDEGFRKVLGDYPADQVRQLLEYHRINGGLSRYVKFRYFFEQIRNEPISEQQVTDLAHRFSSVMMELLINAELLIEDSMQFVKGYHRNIPMHIVSGSDGNELREICKRLDIDKYFMSITGSPTSKTELVTEVLETHHYARESTVLIGDSINDYDAAVSNGISFIGYNNLAFAQKKFLYIDSFKNIIC